MNGINDHYRMWNQRTNPNKCETILFHTRVMTSRASSISQDGQTYKVKHKKQLNLVQMNCLCRFNDHIIKQLDKARSFFRALSRLFFCRSLSHRAKIIHYLLLIRPLITYAAPICWNACASTMEKLRKFERSSVRACLHLYRRDIIKHFISTATIYDRADIPRINLHIIKLCRDYFANLGTIDNWHLKRLATADELSFPNRARTGYLHPQDFMALDKRGLIQSPRLGTNMPKRYPLEIGETNRGTARSIGGSPKMEDRETT